MESPSRIAFFGLGIMGAPMAANLARAGFELAVWTRTGGKAGDFARDHDGVRAAESPAEAAAGAEALVTMLPDAPEVESVLSAAEPPQGALVIDMSTVAPSAARALAEPVSGSRPRAEDGTLTIMAGGEREAFERALPLFEAMGERIVHVGPQGHGQLAKLLTNTMGAVHALALAESVVAVREAGLDPDAF